MFKGIIYLKCCKLKIARIDDKSAENEKCINYQPIKIIRLFIILSIVDHRAF